MRALRWDCGDKGCFRNLCPKLGMFDECFPGRIGMSDVDGVVELSGCFLFMEWKSPGGAVTTGQRIMFEQLTGLSPRVTVIVVCGDPRCMAVETVQVFQRGKGGPVEAATLDGLRERIRAWVRAVQERRTRPSQRVA